MSSMWSLVRLIMLVGLADHLSRLSETLLLFILQLLSLLIANVLASSLGWAAGYSSTYKFLFVFSACNTFVDDEFLTVICLWKDFGLLSIFSDLLSDSACPKFCFVVVRRPIFEQSYLSRMVDYLNFVLISGATSSKSYPSLFFDSFRLFDSLFWLNIEEVFVFWERWHSDNFSSLGDSRSEFLLFLFLSLTWSQHSSKFY